KRRPKAALSCSTKGALYSARLSLPTQSFNSVSDESCWLSVQRISQLKQHSHGRATQSTLSSRRGPLPARAPLRTGHASWPRIRLKHGSSPLIQGAGNRRSCTGHFSGDDTERTKAGRVQHCQVG